MVAQEIEGAVVVGIPDAAQPHDPVGAFVVGGDPCPGSARDFGVEGGSELGVETRLQRDGVSAAEGDVCRVGDGEAGSGGEGVGGFVGAGAGEGLVAEGEGIGDGAVFVDPAEGGISVYV